MSGKKLLVGLVAVAVVLVVVSRITSPTGRVVVAFTDVASSLAGQGVTSVLLNVDNVALDNKTVGSAAGTVSGNTSGVNGDVVGKITNTTKISGGTKTIDLVGLKKLKEKVRATLPKVAPVEMPGVKLPASQVGGAFSGTVGIIADAQVKPGTYNELRFKVSKSVVVTANGKITALIPGQEIIIPGNFVVEPGKTSTILVDVDGDKSVQKTTSKNGQSTFVVAPVMTVESRSNADVTAQDTPSDVSTGSGVSSAAQITGGQVDTRTNASMDETGRVGTTSNSGIPANTSLDIVGDNIIHVLTSADKTVKGDIESAVNSVVNSDLLDIAISVRAVVRGGKTYLLVSGTKDGQIVDVLVDAQAAGKNVNIGVENQPGTQTSISSQGAVNATLASGKLNNVLSVKLVTLNGVLAWRVSGTMSGQSRDVFVDATTGAVINTQASTPPSGSMQISASGAADIASNGGNLDLVLSTTLVNQNGQSLWRVSGMKDLGLRDVFVDASTGAVVSVQ